MLKQLTQYALQECQFDLANANRLSAQLLERIAQHFGLTQEQSLFEILPLAAQFAVTPISGFQVGAIAVGLSGTAYFGANMEWAGVSLNQTVHAEQAAINHAWLAGEKGISDIYVNYSPCGHCRQFMNELSTSDSLNIHVKSRSQQTLRQLLPDAFGPDDLGIIHKLMSPQTAHDKPFDLAEEFRLIWELSYAPYSHCPAVCIINLLSGERYYGAYAENAAFNPSLSPLQSALIMLRLNHIGVEQIAGVELYELKESNVSQHAASSSLLNALCPSVSWSYQQV